jgi:phosphoribosyl-ATP pyrophosphohydrolase
MAQQHNDIIAALYQVILERKANPGEKSYTASLYAKGLDKILGKLGEEATELAVAGKGGERQEIVGEAADVIYHMLVLLGYYEVAPEEIYTELRKRFGISGIEEKESRTK